VSAVSSSSASPSLPQSKNRYEAFEFTEDPFKNYRYEDVFSIADPFSDDATSPSHVFSSDTARADAFEARFPKSDVFDSDDPFGGDFAKEDLVNGNKGSISLNLFDGKEKFSDSNANKLLNSDPFNLPNPVRKPETSIPVGKRNASEDLELAWAAKDSLRLEDERRQREQQEKSDLELAIALSKKDNEGTERRPFRNLLRRGRNTPTT